MSPLGGAFLVTGKRLFYSTQQRKSRLSSKFLEEFFKTCNPFLGYDFKELSM